MLKSIVKLACGVLIMLIIIVGASACASEPDYANQIVETALQSMSDGDYAKHMGLFSPEVQGEISEADFNTINQQIKSVIGDYIDKEFWKTETEYGYTAVYYKANFSEEPEDVIVTVYFEKIDGEVYIAGFLLDSPKLREVFGE